LVLFHDFLFFVEEEDRDGLADLFSPTNKARRLPDRVSAQGLRKVPILGIWVIWPMRLIGMEY
jgi:hypothetical protein